MVGQTLLANLQSSFSYLQRNDRYVQYGAYTIYGVILEKLGCHINIVSITIAIAQWEPALNVNGSLKCHNIAAV